MRRRALLAGIAGGTASLAGCNAGVFTASEPNPVADPTGLARVRPLDDPYVRHGLTSEAGQYLFARLEQPGDSLPVTDAADFSEAVDDLSGDEVALLTNLRTAGAAPAYVWPGDAEWTDDRLRIDLERQASDADAATDEAVGVSLATFESLDERPAGADVVFPSGATLSIGARE